MSSADAGAGELLRLKAQHVDLFGVRCFVTTCLCLAKAK